MRLAIVLALALLLTATAPQAKANPIHIGTVACILVVSIVVFVCIKLFGAKRGNECDWNWDAENAINDGNCNYNGNSGTCQLQGGVLQGTPCPEGVTCFQWNWYKYRYPTGKCWPATE